MRTLRRITLNAPVLVLAAMIALASPAAAFAPVACPMMAAMHMSQPCCGHECPPCAVRTPSAPDQALPTAISMPDVFSFSTTLGLVEEFSPVSTFLTVSSDEQSPPTTRSLHKLYSVYQD